MKKIILGIILMSTMAFGYTQEDLIELNSKNEELKYIYIYNKNLNKDELDYILDRIIMVEEMVLILRREFDNFKDIASIDDNIKTLIEGCDLRIKRFGM